MQWVSQSSDASSFADALEQTASALETGLGGSPPDIVLAFVSPHHREHFDRLPEAVARRCGTPVVVGCSAGGVIGGSHERERTPALALVGAMLPAVSVRPFHCGAAALRDRDPDAPSWTERVGLLPSETEAVLLMPEPFGCDIAALLHSFDVTYPDATKIGAVASGGTRPGEVALFATGACMRDGVVGLALGGNLVVDSLVAQGCRAVGEPMFVTRAEDNLALQLDGRSAARVLQDLYERSGPADREAMRGALFVGIVGEPGHERYGTGDFLVRNIVGLDARSGGLAVAARVRVGTVVQFHVRDARASADDLRAHLQRHAAAGPRPAGVLSFSCLGRGVGLYGEPDFDLRCIREHLGDVPVGGFFGNGELGPIGGVRAHTFLHGYTTALALVRRRHVD
jgi:small ligand-binding sensory domain FIST